MLQRALLFRTIRRVHPNTLLTISEFSDRNVHTKVKRTKGFKFQDIRSPARIQSGYDLIEENLHESSREAPQYASLNALPTLLYRKRFEKLAKVHEFEYGPELPLFTAEQVYLRFFKGEREVLPPIDLNKTNFLDIVQQRYLDFNDHVDFVRVSHSVEVLGRSIMREAIYRQAMYQYFRPKTFYVTTIKSLSSKYPINSHSLYFDTNTNSSEVAAMRKFFSFTKYRALSLLHVYVGMKYLENPSEIDQFTSRLIASVVRKQRRLGGKPSKDVYDVSQFVNSFRDDFLTNAKSATTNYRTVNLAVVFRNTFRPRLFPDSGRLPPIPTFTNPLLSNLLLNIALINPHSQVLMLGDNKNVISSVAKKLDRLGDLVMRRLIMEYLFSNNNKRSGLLMDFHFLNSNVVYGRLTEVLCLHKGLQNKEHQEELLHDVRSNINFKKFYERFGDFFERLIAVLYMDDRHKVREWVFAVMDVVTSTITKESENGAIILEKERFVDLVEKYGFHDERAPNFTFKA